MKAKPRVRLIKNAERNHQKNRLKVEDRPKPGSTAVKSWVVEFQQRDRSESLPAFASLFKDELPEPAPAD